MRSFLRRFGTTAYVISQTSRSSASAFLSSAEVVGLHQFSTTTTTTSACQMTKDGATNNGKTIRVLTLHGSEGTGDGFTKYLETLRTALATNDVHLEITALDAPFPKGNGFAWWTMPPGVRSFTAEAYEGFETSASRVCQAWEASSKQQQQPFDLVLGHSQGAILTAALIALKQTPYHPTKGYILNGVACPNPYKEQLRSLKIDNKPRVLFVMGENDKINPMASAEEVRQGLEQAGMDVSIVKHPSGHSFPEDQQDTIQTITRWLLE
jgi:predicted esterase